MKNLKRIKKIIKAFIKNEKPLILVALLTLITL